jgi:TRAP-type transport system periplasmic protein
MKKRIIQIAIAGMSLWIWCLAPSPGFAQTIELKVSHYLPPNHTIQKALEAWAQEVDKRSDGRLKLKIYPSAQLGPVQRQLDLARNGQADIAVGLTGATPGRYPMTELVSLPFVWPSEGSTSAVMSKRLTELAPKYLAKEYEGLHLLWLGVTPTISFFTARRQIGGVNDVRGLKLRFQGEQHAKILRELGAVPLQIPPGEVADSMGKGVIDGALFNYEASESFGLGSVTKYVTEPGFITATLVLAMNTQKYDELSADLKSIIDQTTGPAAAEQLGKRWDGAEQHGREYIVAQKVSIEPLAATEIAKMKALFEPLLSASVSALEKSGKPAQELLDEYRK